MCVVNDVFGYVVLNITHCTMFMMVYVSGSHTENHTRGLCVP